MIQTFPAEPRNVLLFAPATDPVDNVQRAVDSSVSFDEWNVLLVAYGYSHQQLREAWNDRIDESPANFGSISIGGDLDDNGRGASVSQAGRDVTTIIRNPTDITELGITISLYLDDWTGAQTLVCVHSLDQLLASVETETAFRFLHVLTNRLTSADAVGQFSLDPTLLDERTVRTLEPIFDAIREIEPDEEPSSIPPDVAFDVLKASRRRYILHYLRARADSATIAELTEWIARHEPEADSDEIGISLQHSHLPKLENAELVSVGETRAAGRPAIESIAPYLELVSERDL